jgi:hypothetical protein
VAAVPSPQAVVLKAADYNTGGDADFTGKVLDVPICCELGKLWRAVRWDQEVFGAVSDRYLTGL